MRPQRFRDDIQGMRALAVVSVILYHAGLGPVPGGFVGLDVFFVISGFLIASLLLREVERDGRVSLVGFYARRARRILPAATFVALIAVAGSWFFLNLVDAREAAYDALWASVFAANVRFAAEETDYFAQDAATSPLQHYWSLSVEEQFYVVLPLLVLACALVGRRWRGDPATALLRVVGALTLASLAWSVYATAAQPLSAYFSTFTRAWELGVGVLLAVVAPRAAGALTARARSLLVGLGLTAILVACLVFTSATNVPGYAALLPVAGTAAVLLAGAGANGITPLARRVLGNLPMRAVGDASYSLYLWHWPVLLIASQHLGRDLTTGESVAALVLVAVLSVATYRWIEVPFRTAAPRPLGRALVLYPVSVAVVVVGCLASSTWLERAPTPDHPAITVTTYARTPAPAGPSAGTAPRTAATAAAAAPSPAAAPWTDPMVALVQASARAARRDTPVPTDLEPRVLDLPSSRADLGGCEYGGPPFRLCRRGDPDGTRTLVVLGDSHGRHWIPALEEIAQQAGYTAYYLVKPACSALPIRTVELGTDREWRDCTEFNAWAQRQVGLLRPDLLLVSTTRPPSILVDGEETRDPDTVREEMTRGFGALFGAVKPLAARTVLIGDNPQLPFEPWQCLGSRDATMGECSGSPDPEIQRITQASRRVAVAAGVEYLDTSRWFCAGRTCPAVVGATITMRDHGHVTVEYAEQLAEPLGRALGLWPV